jgi:5-methylcytosine-specific restriction endonuclease McrA
MKRYFTLLFPVIFLLFLNNSFAQRGGHHSYSGTYHSPRTSSNVYHYTTPKSTYKSGSTTYISREHYKSGFPKVARSSSEKEKFLRSKGYTKAPKGYEVDHIQPLSQGGQDNPSNMQLLTKQQHKQKTATERKKSKI